MKTLSRSLAAMLLCLSFTINAQQNNPYKSPLYWSVYEHHIIKEQNGVTDNYIPESEFLANIDWVDTNLKSRGYNIICTDGWGDLSQLSEHGYRESHSSHWSHDFAWWSAELQSRGMQLGMYANPLWIHVGQNDTTTMIAGTSIPVSSLIDASENAAFTWVQVDRPGAEEYVKGYIQYYADMGVKYLRVDFLSWFETGYDRNLGTVGPTRPHSEYVTALQWMREACDANDMYLSLVMPNLTNVAEVEKIYGHLIRINEDTGYGSWYKFSDKDRGYHYTTWSQYATAFDGFVYWSQISAANQVQLDGDFIRLNTFANDNERRSVISLNLLAGGPIAVADQYNSIGNSLYLYQNDELLGLNTDNFRGHPLSSDPQNVLGQTWKGQMSNGDWIIGFFNRETTTVTRTMNFSSLGISGNMNVRDLWQHASIGNMNSISVTLPPHGCAIYKLTSGAADCVAQSITFNPIANQNANASNFSPSATSTSGLPISYEITSGPATIVGNQVSLTGFNGTVFVTANQSGDATQCAAIPKTQSFQVTGGHQSAMYTGGTYNSWTLKPMTFTGGEWVIENVAITSGAHQLKFANTGNWSGIDWGNATGLTGTASVTTGGGANISFSVPESATYTIHFNDITLQYSIVYTGGHQSAMFVGGTFNSWSLSPMTLSSGNWVKQVSLSPGTYQMKFANTGNWSGVDWGNATGLTGTASVTTGGGTNITFTISTAANYTVTFNDVSLAYSVAQSSLAVGENTLSGFTLLPNPATTTISLQATQEIENVVISDMTGRIIINQDLNCMECLLDVSTLPNGVYIVIANSGNNHSTQKLIIQRK